MEEVCSELDSATVPPALVCHVHPMMMFQRCIKAVFQDIHDAIGNDNIKECFVTNVDFRNESFIYKAIACLCSFINSDYSSKPWNRQEHFDAFIHPKKNQSLSLKDHRFNRLFECCIRVLHHIDDVKDYLDTFSDIMNTVAILDRSFLDMELLKPILCAVSLINIHFTGPYFRVLTSKDTNYDTLITVFPKVYESLNYPNIDSLLQTDNLVTNFIEIEEFTKSLPNEQLRKSVDSCIQLYRKEISHLLKLFLPRLAKGFSDQRGALFGFGPQKDDDTGKLLKISDFIKNDADRLKLNKAQVHNLNEERSVGFINYELAIRGKNNIEAASKKMIINKNIEIVKNTNPKDILKFRKPATQIKEIKAEWKERIKCHKKDSYTEKEKARLKNEETKYSLLEQLKKETPPGPFTNIEEITEYNANSQQTEDNKNKRMFAEVKYARITCTSLKQNASVFRLKRDYKNLSTDEYIDNLTSYLTNARSSKTLSITDLNRVLHCLAHQSSVELQEQTFDSEDEHHVGDHVIAYWLEGNSADFFLGVIDKIQDDKIFVSYMVRADSCGATWVYPETAELLETKREQILAKNVLVQYVGSIRIRCKILSETLIADIKSTISEKC